MKFFSPGLILGLALLAARAGAAEPPGGSALDTFDAQRLAAQQKESAGIARAAQLDPKRIVNESSNFLKEREPEMTAEESTPFTKRL